VAVGTGIAAAHVVDGKAFAGAHGAAGEVGHIMVRPGGPICACGARGCLESVASAAALARRYAELSGSPVSAAEVAARAMRDEAVAVRAWGEVVDALADGLTIAQTLFDAAVIVVGGGLSEAGTQLLAPLSAGVRSRLTFQREPALVRAALGDAAGCLGAGLLGKDALEAA
jgi:glucokinase